ncbi:Cell shape-determining protein MreC precursor [compost metagenome]|jgi:rod shape-determining protein MreC|uniref:rod shape-determining protein MreC n=1 Tax=Sphingobacterium faecium TaxID=34087 RepID=UPI000D3CC8B3|nr:rod shape-determining protein MreC [Sphingobacterium faecium]MQP29999.1 rod shape-determining protein MreC [Sphingobacterium faecium]PTX12064.1 rod shape-determining protein MreC [Sphingobacterium faecium]UZJ63577.1 rod shape-determining protein MreC [Sphingobacterium sp. KU25419]
MRNLWLFLRRYNAFFWFILFFGFSMFLVVTNNSFQRASALNSSNSVIGHIYEKVNSWKSYLSLTETNDQLVKENASLRTQLENYLTTDTVAMAKSPVIDSSEFGRYEFIIASVTNNSIHQKSNYLTLNKGSLAGIEKGMGVLAPNGVVGIVLNVTPHFSTVQSLLHPDTKISVTLANTDVFGSLVWGSNVDYRFAMVKEIPNHVKVKTAEKVYTSGYSGHFPKGILVGAVVETGISSGDSFLDLRILLSTNFSNLHHVYVVKDLFSKELKQLEETNQDNG